MRELLWKYKSWVDGWLWPDTAAWGQIQDQPYIFCIGKLLHLGEKLDYSRSTTLLILLILTIKSIVNKNRKLFRGLSYFPLSPQSICESTSQLASVGHSSHYIAVQVKCRWFIGWRKVLFWKQSMRYCNVLSFQFTDFGGFLPYWENPEITLLVESCGAYLFNCCRS